ncbi:MAG: dihydropteroate synthase [Pseudomonadales bacterium]
MAAPLKRELVCAGRRLPLDRPQVMGVLNITPDSFSDGGRFWHGQPDLGAVRAVATSMVEAGAALLDVGGESTRPGARPVAPEDELKRVIPVLEALSDLDVCLSVDTRRASVARAAAQAGAHLLNDVSGFRDPEMVAVMASTSLAGCVMHMRGEPQSMQDNPVYADVVSEVQKFLADRVQALLDVGVDPQRLVLDPGIGFGKQFEHNVVLLRSLESLRVCGLPILVGVSRKRMIGEITGRPVEHRLAGSLAAALAAVEFGADLVRVHDVAETIDALRVRNALSSARHRDS